MHRLMHDCILRSPEAFRLICYLSATTLTLPVMRIVQQEIATAPRVEHLAEVLASGLLERLPELPTPGASIPGKDRIPTFLAY